MKATLVRRRLDATPIAVILHDHRTGRVVYKGDFNHAVYQGFSALVGQPLTQLTGLENKGLRRKVLPTDVTYLDMLTRRFVSASIAVDMSVDVGDDDGIDIVANRLGVTWLNMSQHGIQENR